MSAHDCCNQNCRQGRNCPRRQSIHLENALCALCGAAILAAPFVLWVFRTGGCH